MKPEVEVKEVRLCAVSRETITVRQRNNEKKSGSLNVKYDDLNYKVECVPAASLSRLRSPGEEHRLSPALSCLYLDYSTYIICCQAFLSSFLYLF